MNEERITALQAELEEAKRQGDELLGQLEERDTRLGQLERELAETTAAGRAGQEELLTVRAALDDRDAEVAAATATLREAVASYRASLIAANPDIPDAMIAGATIGDIDASLEKARELAGRVRTKMEQELRATAVPPGAPQRAAPDLSDLSPREKIEYALRKEA